MRSLNLPHGGVWWRRQIRGPQVLVSLVAAACLLVEAVIAKNVIDVQLDFFSQLAPMWIFIAYLVSGLRDRASEFAFIAVIILATAAILALYAVLEPLLCRSAQVEGPEPSGILCISRAQATLVELGVSSARCDLT